MVMQRRSSEIDKYSKLQQTTPLLQSTSKLFYTLKLSAIVKTESTNPKKHLKAFYNHLELVLQKQAPLFQRNKLKTY